MSSQHPNAQTEEENGSVAEPFHGLTRYERRSEVRQISYYLCGEILEPHHYTELFYTLRSASETDLIYLHLNTSGGDFDTGLQIINNMVASNAHVVTVLEARAFSMGAFIFLAGDELVVHDNCQLLFHIYSGTLAGRGHEQQAEALALSNWFERFMTRICEPFLSSSEIKGVLKGADVWMGSDEISRRLARLRRAQSRLESESAEEHGGVEAAGRKDFLKKSRGQIDDLRGRLNEMKEKSAAEAAVAGPDAGALPHLDIEGFQHDLEGIEKQWQHLKGSDRAAWPQLKTALSRAIETCIRRHAETATGTGA